MASESLIYRIKAIWQGGRATAEAAQDIQGVGKAGDKTKTSIKGLATTAAAAGAAIAAAAYTAKQGWDALGEGAEMLRIEDKFAAAAEHIGTTAGELKDAVMDATGGMISEAEATAGALELIDTGLASNQDEVVRLSRLVGELGWDMQALTLTMLNDSEKRLDTLGLSAERVAELEQKYLDLGMAHEQAFDIAVIEAGEEKLEIYGSRLNSTAGQMDVIESAWADVVDHMKQSAALAAGPVIKVWADQVRMVERLNELSEATLITDRERSRLHREMRMKGAEAIEEEVTALEYRLDVATRHERMLMAQTDAQGRYVDVTEKSTGAINDNVDAIAEAEASLEKYGTALEKIIAYEQRREGIDSSGALWQQIVDAYNEQEKAAEEAERAAREFRKEMAGAFLRGLDDGEEATSNLVEEMLRMGPAIGLSADQMKVLAQNTGEYTPEAIEAALRSIEFQDALNKVGEALTKGETNAHVAADALEIYQGVVNGEYNLDVDYDDLTEAERRALALLEQLGLIDGYSANATVTVTWVNSGPVLDTSQTAAATGYDDADQARAHGGPVTAGQPYIVGERGPEWFVPNESGTVLPNGQTPASIDRNGGTTIRGVPGMVQINVQTMAQARMAAGSIAQGLAVRG